MRTLVVVLLLCTLLARSTQAAHEKHTHTYLSGGVPITVDTYTPTGSGTHPALLMIHGADGLQAAMFTRYYGYWAEHFADAGFVVVFPHYFERTNTKFAKPREMMRNYSIWAGALTDALTFTRKLPTVNRDRIGCVGMSLGATLALSLTASDPRIKAVEECFGGMVPGVAPRWTRPTPVLILHGGHDPLVPVWNASRVERLCKSHGSPVEIKIYPNAGHGFVGADNADALIRSIKFFRKWLTLGR